jgi:two-component system CheB/CheR fusion protein
MDETNDESFEALLHYLRDSRGFDFTGYKRTSLMRRVRHRMDQAGYATFEEYLDVLQASADEFAALFNTILINVTAFFRDQEAWEFVKTDVIPRLVAERFPTDPIRVWSAGCASGQEAYTLAMLLADALGPEEFRQRVKIYATDIDEEALAEARTASFDARAVESVPADMLTRYFEKVNGRYVFHKDLRRAVIFGRNDLVKDAPISRVDLLVCRNTLMYLNAETQRNVLARLHFALAPAGRAVPRARRDAAQPQRPVHAAEPEEPNLPQGRRVAPRPGALRPGRHVLRPQRRTAGVDDRA